MPVQQVPAGEEGGPVGFPNLLKEEEQEEDEEEKKVFKIKRACLRTCWWSMEPAVSKNTARQISGLVEAHRMISFVICYIIFKTRINFKEHMNRGAHLLATRPAGVEGRFVWEIMLLLDGISVG